MSRPSDEEQGREVFEESQGTAQPVGAVAALQHYERPENGINDSSRPKSSCQTAQDRDFDEDANDLWTLYGKQAEGHDEGWIKVLKEDMDSVLIFAGLFSGVLTAFVILKIPDLKVNSADQSAFYQNQTAYMIGQISQRLASADHQISSDYTPYPTFHPSTPDRRVNILWLISLVCSLSAALLATLVQQWARAYMRFQQSRNPLEAARIRLFLSKGANRLPWVAEFVPGLIHISLILFFWGLGDVIFYIDKPVFIAILVPILVCICLYLLCVVAPIWNPQSLFWTPFSPYVWDLIQRLRRRYKPLIQRGRKVVNPEQEQQDFQVVTMEARRERSAMELTDGCKKRDVDAVRWLVENINDDNEMQEFVLAISGSFNQAWGRGVWKGVVGDDPPTSTVGPPLPSHLSIQKGSTVYRLCRFMRNFFESESEAYSMDSKVHRTRMRGCIESAASLVCCADIKLDSFGEVAAVLSEVGDKERTKDSSSIESNLLFTVRWTCLSLVAIKQMVNNIQLQELAKFALDGIAPFQTNTDRRNPVAMALKAAGKMDDDLKIAWDAVLDLRLALEPWSQNQNERETEIRSVLNNCEPSIQDLERIASEAGGMKDIDWRIRLLQERMDELTHKLTRRLPGVFFYELPSTVPKTTNEAFDPLSFQTTPIPPQLITPGLQLQSRYVLGQRLRDITMRQNTERNEETLKYLREVPIPLCGLNNLMERQIWRLLDLRDGGGLGFTIELFFLSLRQLSSASRSSEKSPSPEESPSSDLKEVFYTGTFNVIKSDWEKSKNSAGTQRILLELLCDLIIQGRGIFSDFRYPWYIVEKLLDLVGKMVEGLGRGPCTHIDDLLDELIDESESLKNRMNIVLRDEALSIIYPYLDAVSS